MRLPPLLARVTHAARARPRLLWVALAALCFGLALLRPSVRWTTPIGSTLAVVDITQSMNVADMNWQGSTVTRLAYTKELLRRVVRDLPCGNSLGLAVFSERKALVLMAPIEVCAHFAALDDLLTSLDWRMAWAADSHLFYGTYSALDEIEARWPGTSLAFFSDGDQAPALFAGREPRYERRASTPAGVLFGVGSTVPQPVPRHGPDGRITGYWTPEDTAGFASTGAPTLSVADMERMATGGDVRNLAQRPVDARPNHLSQRDDAVLEAVAQAAGLQARPAADSSSVTQTLLSLPGQHAGSRRVELHAGLLVIGALALLSSMLPWPMPLARRRPRPLLAQPRPSFPRTGVSPALPSPPPAQTPS